MRFLLDTHVFLWWILDNPRLPKRIKQVISDPKNTVILSVVSVWEIVIKAKLQKLRLPIRPDEFILEQIQDSSFEVLPIHLAHALQILKLPDIHKDPFDRLLSCPS
jgi:PIN domain nuclease of toxin-antitoxin system